MRRVAFLGWLWILMAGCQTAEKAAITPLPPDAPPQSFADLVIRGKNQVSAAHEFFYRDHWDEVKQAATALRDTAAQLNALKPDGVPPAKRAELASLTKELNDAATALHDSGQAKDVAKTTEVFRRLHLVVRQLRSE